MAKKFPTYALHASVRCFSCDSADMGTCRDTGYPDGRWAKKCNKCGMQTYYDVGVKSIEDKLDETLDHYRRRIGENLWD